MYIEELLRKYRDDHFLSYILRSVLKTCWNYRGQTVLEFDFGTKDGGPFLTLRLRSARKFNFGTKDGTFLMLCFKVRSSIIIYVRITEGGTISYAMFRGPPFIRHVRNTEG